MTRFLRRALLAPPLLVVMAVAGLYYRLRRN
jgi:hypothetical protein